MAMDYLRDIDGSVTAFAAPFTEPGTTSAQPSSECPSPHRRSCFLEHGLCC